MGLRTAVAVSTCAVTIEAGAGTAALASTSSHVSLGSDNYQATVQLNR